MSPASVSEERTSCARILLVEAEDELRRTIAARLRERGDRVEEVASSRLALQRVADADPPFDLLIAGVELPDAVASELLRSLHQRDGTTVAVVMTASLSVRGTAEAKRLGAFDVLQKPLDLEDLLLRVSWANDRVQQMRRAESGEVAWAPHVVAESRALREAMNLAARVAETRSTVLVSGETGTGKEIIAGLIHELSPRSRGPFVKVNCAALPETLLESELFGHERGAFTGAERQRVGRFEQASGGTLFLDEIGDMSPATQAKLLRVLQDQEFHRLGGTRALRTDARIVAATNQDLDRAIRAGGFRQDLYFRLNVIGIHLPPLRERPEDAIALALHFVRSFAIELDRGALELESPALEAIRNHEWRGNVRELRNVIERAVLMCEGNRVGVEDLAIPEVSLSGTRTGWQIELPREGLALSEVERELVLAALRRTGYVQKEAARLLHISRRKLNYMIGRMGLTHPSWRRNRLPRSLDDVISDPEGGTREPG